jgi:peptide/nickel transport system permease protein
MTFFLVKRFLETIPVVILVGSIGFIMIHTAPGDPVQILAGSFAPSQEYLEMVRVKYGLDKPLAQQLLTYWGNVVQGNLGISFKYKLPVGQLILERLGATVLLVGTSMLIFYPLGILLGVVSARHQYSLLDNLATGFSIAGYSIPFFWLGQILILIFAIKLDWFPAQGMRSIEQSLTGIASAANVLRHLILPASVLGVNFLARGTRFMRNSMIDVLAEDYITTARSKGLSEAKVIFKHGVRNGVMPIITLIGLEMGRYMLTGSVLTEVVFGWPGLGRLMYTAVDARDYSLLIGLLMFVSLAVVLANLITDVSYGFLNPRVRME